MLTVISMANDIEKVIDSLPGWVIPATVGGVVLVALFSQNKSGTKNYDTVVYGPQPVDPGIISLAQTETTAKQSVIQTLINALTSKDIVGIQAERDFNVASLGASVANERTRAAEAVAITQSDNDTRTRIFQAQTAGKIVDSQGATAKYIARKQARSNIFSGLFKFGEDIAKAFIPVPH